MKEALRPSRRLIGVFIVFILLPGAILAGFAIRALRQEGQIARQRTRENLERTAEEIGRGLDEEFRQWSEAARSGRFPEAVERVFAEPGGGVFLSVADKILETFPSGALLYRPATLAGPKILSSRPSAALAEAEALEIGRKDYVRAVAAYRRILDTAGAGERPLALHRLARTLRKAGRLEESAAAYRDLRDLESVLIGDLPSDLIARSELCSFAAERGDSAGLSDQALAFYRELAGGRWLLDKPRYLFYSDRCRTWCRESAAAGEEFDRLRTTEERKLSLARAVEKLVDERGRAVFDGNEAFLACWDDEPFRAIVLSTAVLESSWWPRLFAGRGEDLRAVLSVPDGSAVFGEPSPSSQPFAVTRDLRLDGAPWLLRVWPARPETIDADIRQRRTLSLAILGFIVVLLLFGSYVTVRIIRRELEIARLRADFVSTVSHEFRSPLTGIRQLAEMLFDGRVTDPEKQRKYFQMIVGESERLGRLVENVLDFSRMEEGRREYRFEPLALAPWLRGLAADFASEVAAAGARIEAEIPDGLPVVSADKEALGSAVRNLLDNAVKYSPGEKRVWIEAAASGGEVRISVRDKGVGISEEDRKRVFDRFFRAGGEISKRVKGAGLGLSLVKHVVTAHRGAVKCESRPGEGSTFTIRLPAAVSARGEGK